MESKGLWVDFSPKNSLGTTLLALSPGHSQILSHSRGEKSGEGLGSKLCHGPEMVHGLSFVMMAT